VRYYFHKRFSLGGEKSAETLQPHEQKRRRGKGSLSFLTKDHGFSKMNPRTSGLFAFKRNHLIITNSSNELLPPLFGEFHVWVLERWKFASGDSSSGPTDYVNSGSISERELEDFLLRKVTLNHVT
jgi:hypothetical protein